MWRVSGRWDSPVGEAWRWGHVSSPR